MIRMKLKRFTLLLFLFSIPFIFNLSECLNSKESNDPRGPRYAGARTCINCHKNIYSSYLHTAHLKTSRLASSQNIQGSFKTGSNTFIFNDTVKVMMQKHDSAMYQSAYVNGKRTESHRFDIILGNAKGETYLYWKGNQLYQLPISYFKALDSWTNSPGYSPDYVDFSRPVLKRCFECHSSFVQEAAYQKSSFKGTPAGIDKNTMILGIDCERCHGPAADHVDFQMKNPDEKKAKYITSYNSLSKAQKIDMCGVCHSGNKSIMLRSTFAFKPGDDLANFQEPEYYDNSANQIDVHGNQKQLLTSSKCFIYGQLSCTTCHNVHNDNTPTIATYSQKCLSCHSAANHNFCKMAATIGKVITRNCIDCHMPKRLSDAIVVNTSGKAAAAHYNIRTHRIKVYPDETAKVIAWLRQKN